MCYVQKDYPDRLYLSRTVCTELGLIGENFPLPIHVSAQSPESFKHDDHPENCSCPKRVQPPVVPTKMPMPPTEQNRSKLEEWLLNYYGSSTFNTCEHQPLPMMKGPPLHIIIDESKAPHAVHTPIPVPAHWTKAVKEGLDRDERLGVIEPVPWGTATTWCSRMITVAKSDGTP